MVTDGGDDLVNPYRHSTPRRFGHLVRGGALRRRLVLLVAGVVSVALIGGTVATSCGPPPAARQGTQDLGTQYGPGTRGGPAE